MSTQLGQGLDNGFMYSVASWHVMNIQMIKGGIPFPSCPHYLYRTGV